MLCRLFGNQYQLTFSKFRSLYRSFLLSKSKPNNFVYCDLIVRSFGSDSVQSNVLVDCSKIRNIGLVAHIDAGKTTTTERMLYYSGLTHQMGEVHDGDTVMDYMAQERERGITITMASATINWHGHRINLLDTPGHVDFTFEVERSLSVLDGAIVILDGSAGVQAQTMKIWQQSNRYKLPRLIYLNKMDKPNSSIVKCIASIERKLNTTPISLHIPLFDKSNQFIGLIDVVNEVCFHWINDLNESDEGKSYLFQHLKADNPNYEPFLDVDIKQKYIELLSNAREQLFGQLADLDTEFADHILSVDSLEDFPNDFLNKTIRNVCIDLKAVPVLCGSSYKKIGVQPLLESVIRYLPNPMENNRAVDIYTAYNDSVTVVNETHKLCALAFKITYDRRLGALTYIRIYSGTLAPGQMIYNINRQTQEKINKVYRPFADRFVDINSNDIHIRNRSISIGDIIVVNGLSSTITGDTLVCASRSSIHSNSKNKADSHTLAGIQVPDPVFYCSLESPSISKMKQLELALQQLQREDPSFKSMHDKNTNQFVIKGMGELHIDIIKDRIKREYGVDVTSGPLQVSYHETIKNRTTKTIELNKSIGGVNNVLRLTLELYPLNDDIFTLNNAKVLSHHKYVNVNVINTKENNLSGQLKPWHLKWIQMGVFKAMEYGPIFAFPVVGIGVSLHDFYTTSRTSEAFAVNAISQCTLSAFKDCGPILLEPIMKLEIASPEAYIGTILSDLSSRRSEFSDERQSTRAAAATFDDDTRHLLAYVPLSELRNYSTVLRSITSGMASFEMSLFKYQPMNELQAQEEIRAISGVD